jgi:hypothetical protein
MFAFFKNDQFVDFWSNKIGDVFFDLTVSGLKWNRSEIDLFYYPELNVVPTFYEFDSEKKLIIKKEIRTLTEVVSTNEAGEEVVTQEEVVTYETDKIIDPVIYCLKGVMIKPC